MNEAPANGLTDKQKEELSSELATMHKKGLERSEHFHGSLKHYCEQKKKNVAGIWSLTAERKQEIIAQFCKEKTIKADNLELLTKCFEAFFCHSRRVRK